MRKFQYNFFTRQRFNKEFNRQQTLGNKRLYQNEINKEKESYWLDTGATLVPDLELEDYLSKFSKQIIGKKHKSIYTDFSNPPPSDIYPVY